MKVIQTADPKELGVKAGQAAALLIKKHIEEKGQVNIILATGTSQFETLNQLLSEGIDWSKVHLFHLDEYLNIPITHPASFRKYLKERFIDKAGKLASYHLINGETDPYKECERLSQLISEHPIDVAMVGIGENGHLAFNDPRADFDTEKPYLVVTLDEPCRMQQLNEGWFDSLEEVPQQAISMSIRQIMKSSHIICSVPDVRKAQAVKDCLENETNPMNPASILQKHPACEVYLDTESASLLTTSVTH